MPFFSVVIPLYNKEQFIKNTLQSVLNQKYRDFEIIIVNDGSTDNSLEIANKSLASFKDSKIINQENKGLSASRNIGAFQAKGEIIAFLDADDIWHPDFLKQIYFLSEKFPKASLFGTDYLEKFSDNNILEPKKNISINLKSKSFLVEDFFEASYFQPIACQSSFAVKKTVFNDLKFDEGIDYSEDIDFYVKSNLKYKFAYSYNALSTILVDIPNQITSIGIKGKTIPNLEIFEKFATTNTSLKKYLDLNRYFFLIQYKLAKDVKNYNLMLNGIDFNNLTSKQKLLIKCPVILLKSIKGLKKNLLKYNIRLTSF